MLKSAKLRALRVTLFAYGRRLATSHLTTGRRGEQIAAWFLTSRGCRVLESNTTVDGDEIDLVVMDGRDRVVVEVKSTTGTDDPLEAVDDHKWSRIERAASAYPRTITRIDLVGVREGPNGVSITWLRGIH